MANQIYETLRTTFGTEFSNLYKQEHHLNRKLSAEEKKSEEYMTARDQYFKEKFAEYYESEENQKRKEIVETMSDDIPKKKIDKFINFTFKDLKNALKNQKLKYQGTVITKENIMNYVREIEEVPSAFIKNASSKKTKKTLFQYTKNCFETYIKQEFQFMRKNVDYYLDENGEKHFPKQQIHDEWLKRFEKKVMETFSSELIFECLESNPNYKDFRQEFKRTQTMLKEIPENFIDLYPKARLLKRHFVLHIGDTNSGKTYQSLEKLKEVEHGIYLAPLRLLALEVQERMLESNVMCSLSTGEEEDIVPNATHLSATVEKLNINQEYDLCVIDEVQMIQDKSRGWAWTRAILGVCANEVHLCMSENARKITIKLIEECGDTYEIVEHKRNTELKFEEKEFHYPKDVQANDALIVFSRKNVLSVASELESRGIKASILYGALPYPVRKNELQKFINGETSVVVSTDCIGMGLNVPIQRIIFLQTSKYDGFENRMVDISEVKQIAGRAGRYGIYDVGYVNAIQDRKYIKKLLNGTYYDIDYAKINFPETLLTMDDQLSDILITWSKIPDKDIFIKTDIDRDLMLCRYLEQFKFDKQQMLSFINMPFDECNDDILHLWQRLVKKYATNKLNLMNEIQLMPLTDHLETLELAHKKFDLIFSFMKAINSNEEEVFEKVKDCKLKISMKIIEILKKQKNTFKRCSRCGKKLAWNYPYGMCQACFNSTKYYNWDEDEDFF